MFGPFQILVEFQNGREDDVIEVREREKVERDREREKVDHFSKIN